MTKPIVLCVDDEIHNLEALERLLRIDFTCLKSVSGADALKILDQDLDRNISVILCDQRMPHMQGSEFLSQSIKTHPQAQRILLTGYTDMQSLIQAVNLGHIYRYLTKPWEPLDLIQTLKQAHDKFALHQQLHQALEDLKKLDQAKNQFMILINHELKTPLTHILNFSHLLAQTSLDEPQKKSVSRIDEAALRLKKMIEEVLLVMRSETGLLKIDQRSFLWSDLQILISAADQELMRKKNLKLQVGTWDKKIVFDPRLLEQVIDRLLKNAIQFSFANEAIQIDFQETRPHRVEVQVKNQGPPLDSSDFEFIKKPFFINEDMMKHSQGLGLGLTVCQSLLKNFQSELRMKSDGDQVTFAFELSFI